MRASRSLLVAVGLLGWASVVGAQTFPSGKYFRQVLRRPAGATELPGLEGLNDYVVGGKLRLKLADAIRLALLNNTEVRIQRLQYEETRFALQRAYQPFDPIVTSGFNATRSTSPTTSQLQGAPTLSNLDQQTQFRFSQTFPTGTRY